MRPVCRWFTVVRRLATGLVLVLVTTLGVGAPVVAQEVSPDEMRSARSIPGGLADDTLRYVFLEVALLEELDAFTPTNADDVILDPTADFEIIHSRYGNWPETERDKLLAVLDAVDTELATRAAAFRILPDVTNPLLDFAVARMPADWRAQLSVGETQFIQGFEYAGAIRTLIASDIDPDAARSGNPFEAMDSLLGPLTAAIESLTDAEEMNGLLTAEIADLQREVAALATTSRPGPRTGSPAPWTRWLIAGVGGLSVLVLIGVIAAARVSRRRMSDHVATDAMEAHQLLSATRTEADVADVVASIGATLTGAHGVSVLRRTADGLRPAGQSDVLIASGLSRVVELGQPLARTLSNDPFLPGVDAEVVGVPVVAKGSIIAVIIAWNVGTKSLPRSTRNKLELISPAIGSALMQVDELGTMEKMAMIDGLTSLGNRRRLDGDLESTLADAVASDLPVGFAMIDVDHFKIYNDTHGHTAGDVALQNVAATIAACVRDSDVVYRYGGEEFSMLLPGASPEEAVTAAERVRAAVEALQVAGEHLQPSGKLTVSIGVATLESGRAGDIKERADAALYRAKSVGRNTVVVD